MECVSTEHETEFEFVRSCVGRPLAAACCRGPKVPIVLPAYRLEHLEGAIAFTRLEERLYANYTGDATSKDGTPLRFTLCVAHWVDLGYVMWQAGREQGRHEWMNEAGTLISTAFDGAGFDRKEMSNLFRWRYATRHV